MVYRKEITHDEIVDTLDVKYLAGSIIGNTLRPRSCEISKINLMLKSVRSDDAKPNITIDDFRLRSNLTTH